MAVEKLGGGQNPRTHDGPGHRGGSGISGWSMYIGEVQVYRGDPGISRWSRYIGVIQVYPGCPGILGVVQVYGG